MIAGPCCRMRWPACRSPTRAPDSRGGRPSARDGTTPDRATKCRPVFSTASGLEIQRSYPALRLYGADAAVPLSWFTVKAEAAYYTSPGRAQDEYVIYVVQLERQIRELSIVAGYAGSAITARVPGFQFSPDLGFARALLAHMQYTIDTNRNVSLDAAIRQNGAGSWLRGEYSQGLGQHWRVTAGLTLIRGTSSDFLGEYRRN